jgi:hypothetical protein
MGRSCWACGQHHDGGLTHCAGPACGLPLDPDLAAVRIEACGTSQAHRFAFTPIS